MIEWLGSVDPATFAQPTVWLIAAGFVGASGLGYKAFRFGHDHIGPIVEGVIR